MILAPGYPIKFLCSEKAAMNKKGKTKDTGKHLYTCSNKYCPFDKKSITDG